MNKIHRFIDNSFTLSGNFVESVRQLILPLEILSVSNFLHYIDDGQISLSVIHLQFEKLFKIPCLVSLERCLTHENATVCANILCVQKLIDYKQYFWVSAWSVDG